MDSAHHHGTIIKLETGGTVRLDKLGFCKGGLIIYFVNDQKQIGHASDTTDQGSASAASYTWMAVDIYPTSLYRGSKPENVCGEISARIHINEARLRICNSFLLGI